MTPTEMGRLCAACHTQVVDFTSMSDEEVVAFVRHTTPGSRCGRFREDQVGRPLRAAVTPVSGWRRWAGAAVLLLGPVFGLKARAQGQESNTQALAPAMDADSLLLVEGVVRNRWGARTEGVWVRMGSLRDTTDARGYFRLLLPKCRLGTVHTIVLNYHNPRHDERRLAARVPFDPARIKPYHITLKKAPVIRNPGFY
ncbi:hypothetical protein [Hymenobacter sp. B1770]|uniref:hypothetical protein n=1 Tax=Hymenobacter sp. B1770 TaxID=1718788 RepID=UPI003CEAA6F4